MSTTTGGRAAIAVVVTCYNQAGLIGGALSSVLAQSRADAISEIVLVDDGSTDGSPDVIDRLRACDGRITVVTKPNGGAGSARNAGIAASNAPWIAFLDGDDAWAPRKIEVFLEAVERFPEAGLICSDFLECDQDLKPKGRIRVRPYCGLEPAPLARLFVEGGPILPSAALVARRALDACGGFDESFRVNEDPELWLRIAARYPLHHIDLPLTLKRNMPGSLGSSENALRNWEAQRRITCKMLTAHPQLRQVKRQRLARDYARLAFISAQSGRRGRCASAIFRSLLYRPMSLKVWSYLLALVSFDLYCRAKGWSGPSFDPDD